MNYDREYLYSRGWRERSCTGPWRWYKLEWKPVAYYTLHDALGLERSVSKSEHTGGTPKKSGQ
jgi:hypothetical protein